jgi:hypothetical protein
VKCEVKRSDDDKGQPPLLGSKLEAAVPLAGGRRHGLDGPPLAAAREGGRHLSPTADGVTARSAWQLWWAQRLRAATVR